MYVEHCVDGLPPLMLGLEMSPAVAIPGRGAGGKTPRATRIEFLFYYILTRILKTTLLKKVGFDVRNKTEIFLQFAEREKK